VRLGFPAGRVGFNPCGEGVHISRDEFPCRVIDKISTLIEEIRGVPDVSLDFLLFYGFSSFHEPLPIKILPLNRGFQPRGLKNLLHGWYIERGKVKSVGHCMKLPSRTHSYSTLGAIAAVAFIVACVAHEAIGHGGMCLALGGRVTLLTSVYFRCTNGGPLTDAAGPLMNLIVGGACWLLARHRPLVSRSRLFFILAMAFNLFWGAGYFIFSAIANTGDWAFVLRDLTLEPRWLWRLLMGALGVGVYVRSARAVATLVPPGTPLVWPYLVAGVVSCVAVLFYAGPTLPAVREAARSSFGAAVGLLFLAYRGSKQARASPSPILVAHSNGWLLFSALVTILFFLVLGRGCGVAGHG